MPKIQIRPAIEEDILKLVSLEHDYTSEYVWQMEIQQTQTRTPGSPQVAFDFESQLDIIAKEMGIEALELGAGIFCTTATPTPWEKSGAIF